MKGKKYLSVIAAYAVILAIAVLSLVLMFIVGAPEIVFILEIVGIVFNLTQIALYIAHAAKSAKGDPATGLGRAIFGVNLAWIVLTAANFVLASIGAYLRTDLAVVWLCQVITVLLVYFMWNKIEYKVALKNYACTDESKIKTGGARYAVFFAIVVIIQIVALVLPLAIMSTRFRNEGLHYRNIMYESSEDGTEYYVKGVYWGSSKSVFIPAEFNGRKVTKILDGAIDSETVWNKLFTSSKEIETVIFEDTEEHPSNIREIGDRAIVGNSITEISLPSSVQSIGQQAIVSDNLKKVELFAQNGNVYFGTSIVTPVLETLSISATSEANIVFEDTFQKDGLNVTIVNDNEDASDTDKVQEKYNYIRENYPEIREGLSVENVTKKVIVNFESNINGVFVPSRILDLVSGVAELPTNMLGELWYSTNEFIKNKTFFNEDLIFTDEVTGKRYVFRGWENELHKLESFDPDTYKSSFNKNTTLSARWAEVCNVTYDWGKYYVPIESSALEREFIVGEEANNFMLPTFARYERAGYRDLKWYCFDEADTAHYSLSTNYLSSAEFAGSVVITPVWEMDYVSLGVSLEYDAGKENSVSKLNSTSTAFEYDKTRKLDTTYSISHPLNKTNRYAVSWSFVPSDGAAVFGAENASGSFSLKYDPAGQGFCSVTEVVNMDRTFVCAYDTDTDALCFSFVTRNVVESGRYTVTVVAVSANPERAERVTKYAETVEIIVERKTLTPDEYEEIAHTYQITFDEGNFVYQEDTARSITAKSNADAPILFGEYVGNGESAVNLDGYEVSTEVVILKEKGGAIDPNYNPYTIYSKYTISKTMVKVRWKIDGTGDSTARSIEYDGTEHRIVAELYNDNTVILDEIVLVGNVSGIDCGSYSVQLPELSQEKSYALDEDLTEQDKTCTWYITPRPVALEWSGKITANNEQWNVTTTTYNGKTQTVTARVINLADRAGEVCTIDSYQNNYGVNAGTYTAAATLLSNGNYTLENGQSITHDWTIEKKSLTVDWRSDLSGASYSGNVLFTKYNAEDQTIYAVATNPCTNEQSQVDAIEFVYAGGVRGTAADALSADTVSFRDAGNYTLSVIGIKNDAAATNYTIKDLPVNEPGKTCKSCNWTIDKITLRKEWAADYSSAFGIDNAKTYNGFSYTFRLAVTDFVGTDVRELSAANFSAAANDVAIVLSDEHAATNDGILYLDLTVTHACTYMLDVSAELKNYVLPKTTGTEVSYFVITPSPLAFKWYTNEACTAEYSALVYSGDTYRLYAKPVEELYSNDTLTLTLGGVFEATKAGTYTATINGIGNSDYTIADGHSSKSWTVAKKLLTITPDDEVNKVYGGDVKTAKLVISGFVKEEVDLMPIDAPTDALTLVHPEGSRLIASVVGGDYKVTLQAVNVGTYTLTLTALKGSYSGLVMDNYRIATPVGVTLNIDQLPISLTWSAANDTRYIYNGGKQTVTATIANKVQNVWKNDDWDAPILSYSGGTSYRNVGEYTTTVTAVDDPNYTLGDDLVRNWYIDRKTAPAALTGEWTLPNDSVYDKSEKTATLTITGVVTDDCKNVWRNKFSVSVHQTSPVVSESPEGMTTAFAWDIESHSVTFTFTYIDAASFDITVTLTDTNYFENPKEWAETFTIEKKQLTYSWGLADVNYDLEYDGTDHKTAYVATATNALNGDEDGISFCYTYSGEAINVGPYETTVIGIEGDRSTNYYVVNGTKSWNITKRTLRDFTWTNADGYVYSGTEKSVTARSATNPSVTFTYKNDGGYSNSATNAGTYTARIQGIVGDADKNYRLPDSPVTNSWSIAKAPLTVTDLTAGQTYTYNADPERKIDVLKISGLKEDSLDTSYFTKNNGSLAISTMTYDGSGKYYTIAVNANNAGDYIVSLNAVFGETNYTIKEGSSLYASFNIAKKELIVDWQDANTNFVYDGSEKVFRVAVSGEAGGEANVYSVTGNTNTAVVTGKVAKVTLDDSKNGKNYKFKDCGDEMRTLSSEWSILKRSLSVSWSNTKSNVYDGETHTLVATITNVVEADRSAGGVVTGSFRQNNGISVAGSVDGSAIKVTFAMKNAAGYACDLSVVNNNYEIDAESASSDTYTISQRTLGSFTWTDDSSFTYNGVEKAVIATAGNKCVGDTLTFSYEGNTATNAGTSYVARITGIGGASASNYKLPDSAVTKSWSIDKQVIVIDNKNIGSQSYTGSELTFTCFLPDVIAADRPSISGNYNNPAYFDLPNNVSLAAADIVYAENNLQITFRVTKAGSYTNENAGKYTVTIGKLNDNYTISGNGKVTFAVTKKAITADLITLASNSSEYSGKSFRPTVLIDNVALDPQCIGGEGTFYATSAGNYSMTVNALDNENYALNGAVSKTLNWSITPKAVTGATATFTVGNDTVTEFTYGDPNAVVTLAWTGAIGALSFAGKDVETTGGVLNASAGTVNFSGVTAGTYHITINTFENLDDHTLTNNVDITVVVKKKQLSIITPTTSLTYNGTTQTYNIVIDGLVNGDTKDKVYSVTDNTGETAGGYTAHVTLTGTKSTNYVLDANNSTSKSLAWSINKATLSISWPDDPEAYEYTGAEQEFHALVEGFPADKGLGISYSVSGDKETNCSQNYTATVALIDATNFMLSGAASKGWSIKKKTVSVSWPDQGATYTYNGQSQTFRANVSGYFGDASNVYTLTGNTATNAGAYTATVALKNSTNYVLSGTTSQSWSIGKKALTVTWTDEHTEYTYSGAERTYRISVSDALEGDGAGVGYSISGNTGTNAGSYLATVTILKTNNYKFAGDETDLVSESSKSWTIKKKRLKLSYTAEYDYTGSQINMTYGVTDLLDKAYDSSAIASATGTQKTLVGTHEATITLDDNHCFSDGTKSTTVNWTINKRLLRLVFNGFANDQVVYDGSTHRASVTIKDHKSDETAYTDQCTVTVTNDKEQEAPAPTNAGTYILTVTLKDSNNYRIVNTVSSYTWTITPKPITLYINTDFSQFVYDGLAKTLDVKTKDSSGNIDNDARTDLTISGDVSETDAGNYRMDFSWKTGNYKFVGLKKKDNTDLSTFTEFTAYLEWSVAKRALTLAGMDFNVVAQIKETSQGEDAWDNIDSLTYYPYLGEDAYQLRLKVQYKNAMAETVTITEGLITYNNTAEDPYTFGWVSSNEYIYWGLVDTKNYSIIGGNTITILMAKATLDNIKGSVQPGGNEDVRQYTLAELKSAVTGGFSELESSLTFRFYETYANNNLSNEKQVANLVNGKTYYVKVTSSDTHVSVTEGAEHKNIAKFIFKESA